MANNPLWRAVQRNNFTDWKKLSTFLKFDSDKEQHISRKSKFPLNLPVRLAEKIQKNQWDDPILRQFLPTVEELKPSPLFLLDPVGDESFRPKPKLLHKYH